MTSSDACEMRWPLRIRLLTVLLLALGLGAGRAAGKPSAADSLLCVGPPAVAAAPADALSGLILTAFDRSAMWVLDVATGRRYPLPETLPCAGNCHLSPDLRSITYFNDATNAINRMRLNGTGRELVSAYANDVQWWAPGTFLIWTPGNGAYLQAEGSSDRQMLDVSGVSVVQPGGYRGLRITATDAGFVRELVDLTPGVMASAPIPLGPDVQYFDAGAWSPDGSRYAFAAPILDGTGAVAASDLFVIALGQGTMQRVTTLESTVGRARINGLSSGELSWSPDGTRIALWVTPLGEDPPEAPTRPATLYVVDVAARAATAYCGYASPVTTPNPPRLRWSPDGGHIAFAGVTADAERGWVVLALDVNSGVFAELSEGVYPAIGTAEVIAWGLPPG